MSNITLFQVENGLDYPLAFANLLLTSSYDIGPLNPGVTVIPSLFPLINNLIPDCTGQEWWSRYRMVMSGGTLYMNLWKENNEAFYYLGSTTTYPGPAKVSLGVFDGGPQQLTISYSDVGGFEVSLGSLPNNLGSAFDWMTQNYSALSKRKLREISMPGSHDAGISVVTAATTGAGACNSKTQAVGLLGQLNAGSRYFDLRPCLWASEVHSDAMYLGHFNDDAHYWLGVLGQSLEKALAEVAQFLNQPDCGREVVILKFSHCYNIDNNHQTFDKTQYQSLVDKVKQVLGDYLYKNTSNSLVNLNELTFDKFAQGKQRVIAVFDNNMPSELFSQSEGIFRFNGDAYTTGNLNVYDDDSGDQDYNTMKTDQLNKFKNFSTGTGFMFLLSWTLPWKIGHPSTCIDDLARPANLQLETVINDLISDGTIIKTKTPNILYHDFVDPAYNVADICIQLNTLRATP